MPMKTFRDNIAPRYFLYNFPQKLLNKSTLTDPNTFLNQRLLLFNLIL